MVLNINAGMKKMSIMCQLKRNCLPGDCPHDCFAHFHMVAVKKPRTSTQLYEWPTNYWVLRRDQPHSFWNFCVRFPIFKSTMLSWRGVWKFCKSLQSKLKLTFHFPGLVREMQLVVVFHTYLFFLKYYFYPYYGWCKFVKILKNILSQNVLLTKQWLSSPISIWDHSLSHKSFFQCNI